MQIERRLRRTKRSNEPPGIPGDARKNKNKQRRAHPRIIEELRQEPGEKLIDTSGITEELADEVSVEEKNGFLRLIDKLRIYSQ